jgi:hypothetical protein
MDVSHLLPYAVMAAWLGYLVYRMANGGGGSC